MDNREDRDGEKDEVDGRNVEGVSQFVVHADGAAARTRDDDSVHEDSSEMAHSCLPVHMCARRDGRDRTSAVSWPVAGQADASVGSAVGRGVYGRSTRRGSGATRRSVGFLFRQLDARHRHP